MYVKFVIVTTVYVEVCGQSVQVSGVLAVYFAIVSIDEEIIRTKQTAKVSRKRQLTIKFYQ